MHLFKCCITGLCTSWVACRCSKHSWLSSDRLLAHAADVKLQMSHAVIKGLLSTLPDALAQSRHKQGGCCSGMLDVCANQQLKLARGQAFSGGPHRLAQDVCLNVPHNKLCDIGQQLDSGCVHFPGLLIEQAPSAEIDGCSARRLSSGDLCGIHII